MDETIYKMKKIIKELSSLRGRHTELISVYIPKGYPLHEIGNLIANEISLTQNVKSKAVRKNVTSALTKIQQHLKLYKKTPPNGLAIFCGNVSKSEGVADVKIWAIEPHDPIKNKLYWCDQKFELKHLEEMIEEKDIYGLIIMDNGEATVGLLKGKSIKVIRHLDSLVPGKTAKGGQCLASDTLIFRSNGNIKTINQVKNGESVKTAIFNNTSIKDSAVIDAWKNQKYGYKIITKYPRIEIRPSEDHTFFILKNDKIIEKTAKNLSIEDTLLMPESVNIKGSIQKLNTNFHFWFTISKEGRSLLKKKRLEEGLHQKNLAQKIGLTQTAISTIELGKRDFQLQNVKKLCKELGINFNKFSKKHIKPKNKAKLPRFLDKDLSQVLGYFLGDGNFDTNRITFSEGDKELASYYKDKIESIFSLPIHFKKRRTKNYYEIRAQSKAIKDFITSNFFPKKATLSTLIPEKVLNSTDNVLASFLRGFFDAEGYVSSKLALGINNKLLVQQIQMCLLRFGIISSFIEYDNRRNPYSDNHRFTLEITDKKSLELFRDIISFGCKKKTNKLNELIRKRSIRGNTRQIFYSGKHIREIIEKHGLKISDFPKVTNFFRNERMMSKYVFENSIMNEVKKNRKLYNELEKVLNFPLLPVKIKQISKLKGKIEMDDISVKNQNFIANCLLVHNSAARFGRVREGLKNDFYKKVAATAKAAFTNKKLKGILLGGPGPVKETFHEREYLQTDLRNIVLGTRSIGYADEGGLKELVEKSMDLMEEASIKKEKDLLKKFFTDLKKATGLATYGMLSVVAAIRKGAVKTILVNEDCDWEEVEYTCNCGYSQKQIVRIKNKKDQKCPDCSAKLKIIGEMDILEALDELAKQFSTSVEVISTDTPEGSQLEALGGVGAILRYKI